MAKKLKTHVHAVERNDQGEITNQGTFGPDDDLSKPENRWVEKAVSNPDVWEGSDDQADAAEDQNAKPRTPPKAPGK